MRPDSLRTALDGPPEQVLEAVNPLPRHRTEIVVTQVAHGRAHLLPQLRVEQVTLGNGEHPVLFEKLGIVLFQLPQQNAVGLGMSSASAGTMKRSTELR